MLARMSMRDFSEIVGGFTVENSFGRFSKFKSMFNYFDARARDVQYFNQEL